MTYHVQNKHRRRAKKKAYKKSGVFATNSGFVAGPGGSRASILKAALVFMEQARKSASRFSKRIPPATHVEGYGEQQAMVVTDGAAAPNAAPFEFALRHPLFGDTEHWYPQPRRPYMSNAARNKGARERASQIYGDAEAELLAEEYGYTE